MGCMDGGNWRARLIGVGEDASRSIVDMGDGSWFVASKKEDVECVNASLVRSITSWHGLVALAGA